MSTGDPFEGKESISDDLLAEVMRNDLIGRTVSNVRITGERITVVFDTGQELEFAPKFVSVSRLHVD